MKLRLGTRGSALALAQAAIVARELLAIHPDVEIEMVRITTSGDLLSSRPPEQALEPGQGNKGLFVKEIEQALSDERIDFAVHSAKDLPADLLAGLDIAAYPPREDPRDVFVGRDACSWRDLKPGARIGTSSLRRGIQFLQQKPEAVIVPMRGNVDTRLRKLESGACEGLILAQAGLKRLGLCDDKHEVLPEDVILPSPGQGALALEIKKARGDVAEVLADLDHVQTRLEVEFERAFLKEMGGGCSIPLGARASAQDGEVVLSVFYSDVQGKRIIRLREKCLDVAQKRVFVKDLAGRVRSLFAVQ